MPIHVTVTTDIQRPRDVVAAYTAAPDNDTPWCVDIERIEWLTERPAALSTRVAHFLGRPMAYTDGVAELVPGERLVMTSNLHLDRPPRRRHPDGAHQGPRRAQGPAGVPTVLGSPRRDEASGGVARTIG